LGADTYQRQVLLAIATVCFTTQLEALALVAQRIRTLQRQQFTSSTTQAMTSMTSNLFLIISSSVAMEWKQTTRSTTVEEGETPEDGIYMQREVARIRKPIPATILGMIQVKTRAAVSPIPSVPGTQMKLKSLRCATLQFCYQPHQHDPKFALRVHRRARASAYA
jgi:hypothetical protein